MTEFEGAKLELKEGVRQQMMYLMTICMFEKWLRKENIQARDFFRIAKTKLSNKNIEELLSVTNDSVDIDSQLEKVLNECTNEITEELIKVMEELKNNLA